MAVVVVSLDSGVLLSVQHRAVDRHVQLGWAWMRTAVLLEGDVETGMVYTSGPEGGVVGWGPGVSLLQHSTE